MEQVLLDRLWILICAILVFLMQGGFLCLEAGATRQKNSINVALKNITDFAVSILLFWLLGYGLMFGITANGWGTDFSLWSRNIGTPEIVFFLFQAMFCGTAVAIVSGAIAERMHFRAYVVLSALVSGLIYPVFGHWAWNGLQNGASYGWLGKLGFVDFAGSTVVHGLGGGVALAAMLIIGPRRDRFDKNGSVRSIYGSDFPRTILGALILWFGWLGFNGGSTLAFDDTVPRILLNTVLGGAGGLLIPLLITVGRGKRVEVEWITNGCLAGLVSVTACCHVITPTAATVVGAMGGVVMFISGRLLLRCCIDDAVGAVPVHLGGGIWGTLAVALFGNSELIGTGLSPVVQLGVQLLGVLTGIVWAGGATFITLWVMARFTPLRVSAREELLGLNIVEHGARSDLVEMFEVMSTHQQTGNLSLRVPAEPFTEVGQIAARYNDVIGALERSTAKTQAIINTASEAIFTVFPSDHTIRSANAVAYQLFRYESHELIGRASADLFDLEQMEEQLNARQLGLPPEDNQPDQPPLQDRFWNNLRTWAEDGQIVELVGRRHNQQTFPVELRATTYQQGSQGTLIVILSDISLRKLNERALKQAASDLQVRNERLTAALESLRNTQAQLVQNEKISALGKMVAGIAHEMNNPMGFISGNLAYLHEYVSDLWKMLAIYEEHLPSSSPNVDLNISEIDLEFLREDLPNVLQSMHNGVDRVRAITNSLRTFSRLDEASLKTVDLHECIDSTLLLLEYSVKANEIQLIRDYGNLPSVECFTGNLNQVFFNILSNAIDALAGQKGLRSPLLLMVSTEQDGDSSVIIRIRDNGSGISAENLNRIFDPFYTTKAVGEGTGLGLAVSYQIVVDEHHGQLTVDSTPGESTTFNIRIPCRQTLKTRPGTKGKLTIS